MLLYYSTMSGSSEQLNKFKLVTIKELCEAYKSGLSDNHNNCFICNWNKSNEKVNICDEHNNILQDIEDKAEAENKKKEEKKRKLKRRIDFNEQQGKKENNLS